MSEASGELKILLSPFQRLCRTFVPFAGETNAQSLRETMCLLDVTRLVFGNGSQNRDTVRKVRIYGSFMGIGVLNIWVIRVGFIYLGCFIVFFFVSMKSAVEIKKFVCWYVSTGSSTIHDLVTSQNASKVYLVTWTLGSVKYVTTHKNYVYVEDQNMS